MADVEKYGVRDLVYSAWHRVNSLSRFLSHLHAWRCGMIDIDDVEYCRWCYRPLALIETAQDVGQHQKGVAVTQTLAEMACIPAYLVFYTVTETEDVSQFRVTSLTDHEPYYQDATLEPAEYAQLLKSFHDQHAAQCPRQVKK